MSKNTLYMRVLVEDNGTKKEDGVPKCKIKIAVDPFGKANQDIHSVSVISGAYKLMQAVLEKSFSMEQGELADLEDGLLERNCAYRGDEPQWKVLLNMRRLEQSIAHVYNLPPDFIDRFGKKGTDY